MTQGVKVFLTDLGMMKYFDMFMIRGFDDESDIPYLTTYDLEDTIMVTNQSDIDTILSHACVYRPSSEHAVYAWLCSNALSHYFIGFIQSELTDLRKIAQLSLPNEDLYDELEIVLPGHRKRLERAVQRLKLEQINNPAAETLVSSGWWGKPECLPQAKFDFLCVKASLFSSHDPHNIATIDFMVDSGSDVSTVQEDTLKKLNLELIGPVYSCGIHGGNHTNLYKGRLKVGDQELDIEVMGSNYDSLGSRVVRHFRHIIDGYQHIWLKGNYTDPLPAIVPIEFPIGTSSSHLSEQSGHRQVALPIAGAEDTETEFAEGNLDQVAKALGTNGDGMNSENQQINPIAASTNSSSFHAEQSQHLYTGESTSLIRSLSTEENTQHQGSPAAHERLSVTKKPLNPYSSHSSANILSSHNKHSAFSNKGKRSLKYNSYGSKSSLKRKHNNSKSSLPKTSLQRFSGDADDRSEPSVVEIHHGRGVATDSAESSSGRDTHSASGLHSDERVSLCNILPLALRDTDDDIDHLGDPVRVCIADPRIQTPWVSENCIDKLEVVNMESDTQEESLKSVTCGQILFTCHHQVADNGQKCDCYDVVHIDGLHFDKFDEDDNDNCSSNDISVKIGRDGKKLEINVIPAYNESAVIYLDETDRPVQGR